MSSQEKVDRESFRERAIAAVRESYTAPTPTVELAQVLAGQDVALTPHDRQLSAEAVRAEGLFKRDAEVLGHHISRATIEMNRRLATFRPDPRVANPPQQERLHVFAPSPTQPNGPRPYDLEWRHVDDDVQGVDIGAGAAPATGQFSASQSGHGFQQRSAYAGLGVTLTPNLGSTTLSVRPLVNWAGLEVLNHRLFDPEHVPARGWGGSHADLSIRVYSWDVAGGGFIDELGATVALWHHDEVNPPSLLVNHSGSEDPRTLMYDVHGASNQRRYAIWVSCRASITTQAKFGLDIFATAAVVCQMPILFVEEMNP